MKNKVDAIFLLHLPPPYHGVAAINKNVVDSCSIADNLDYETIPFLLSENHHELKKVNLKKFFKLIGYYWRVLKELVSKKPAFFYFSMTPFGNGFFKDSVFIWIAKSLGVKPILHFHGVGVTPFVANSNLIRRYYKSTLKGCAVIHLCDSLIQMDLTPLDLPKTEVFTLPNTANQEKNLCDLEPKAEKKSILFLSNLKADKGILDALKIFEKLKQKFPELNLQVAGGSTSPEVDAQINQFIDEQGLANSVVLHGFVDVEKKKELLSSAILLLHPTYNDAFPLVILEAMLSRVAVVSTNIGAIPTVLSKGNVGLLSEAGDIEDIFNNCVSILEDKSRLAGLVERAEKKYWEQYSNVCFENNILGIFRLFTIESKGKD